MQRLAGGVRSCLQWFTCLCHLLVCATALDVSVTLTNIAITMRQQSIPTSPRIKNPRSGNISAGGLSKRRQICTWPCLRCGVLAADKLRTDVFVAPFPPLPWSSIPFLATSSFPNLGVIVCIIKHSCTDSFFLTHLVQLIGWELKKKEKKEGSRLTESSSQTCSPHGNVQLFP